MNHTRRSCSSISAPSLPRAATEPLTQGSRREERGHREAPSLFIGVLGGLPLEAHSSTIVLVTTWGRRGVLRHLGNKSLGRHDQSSNRRRILKC